MTFGIGDLGHVDEHNRLLNTAAVANVTSYGTTGTADDSAVFQDAVDALGELGGGTLYVPDGLYRVSNVLVPNGVGIVGPGGSWQYGFTNVGRGATIRAVSGAANVCVLGATITAGGSSYETAPTVTFTGGTGSGAAATAFVSGGAVVGIEITSPGTYTSPPTIGFTGGGGSGATAAVAMGSPIFYTSGSESNLFGISFRGLTLEGLTAQQSAGIVLDKTFHASVENCHLYNFNLQAVWQMAGQSFRVASGQIFGAQRTGTSLGYHIGALQIDGSDSLVTQLEVGAGASTDETDLWNAAVHLGGSNGGAAQITNLVAEGSDVGVRVLSSNNCLTGVRADINYGHGFHVTRLHAGVSPPRFTRLIGCWGHRNSRYTTDTFDNFHITTGQSITTTKLIGCHSGKGSGDAWAHRYGLFDGGTTTVASDFTDDGAETAATNA